MSQGELVDSRVPVGRRGVTSYTTSSTSKSAQTSGRPLNLLPRTALCLLMQNEGHRKVYIRYLLALLRE